MDTSLAPQTEPRYRNIPNWDTIGGLLAIETFRLGGVSPAPWHSLNLGRNTLDHPWNPKANEALLVADLGIRADRLAYALQCHGADVRCVDEPGLYPEIDALVTRQKDLYLQILVADCVPILMVDPIVGVIAAVHAGWRGTALAIGAKTLAIMAKEYGSRPADCQAYVGTCIGKSFYEVDREVASHFPARFAPFDDTKKKYMLDLKGINGWQLQEAGLLSEHICYSPYCTVKDNRLFFSHRGEGGNTGRFGVIIGMQA